MSTEVFEKINSIEQEAEKIVHDAKNQAALLIRTAQENGQKFIDDSIKKSRQQAQKIIDEAITNAQKQARDIESSTQSEISQLKTNLKEKIDRAKKIIK
ncbi:MAG: hypothetical protein KKH83_02635 [Candidatus Margulisbacteria bacterium]|nr:hypothetical protein [Candidatus Margulisiibacteriota bacterium]